jgi:hypothetical protein
MGLRRIALVGSLLGWALACGGGGGGSSTPPAPPAPPTLSSFTPTSGVVGAPITLTGTHLTGATQVSFHGTSAAFTVQSDTSVQATVPVGATSGTVAVTTAGGTATSAGSFTVSPTPAPTLTSFLPASGPVGTGVTLTGTGFWGATAVRFGGTSATFTIQSNTQITAVVPAGAATGTIQVVNGAGTATSAATFTVTLAASLDLTVDGLYLTQATQNYPAPAVPLVKDRSAWVRVFVKANEANSASPAVRVRFINGGTTNTLTIPAPAAGVPQTINEGVQASSWNMAVPAAWMQPGVHVIADVDPTGSVPEADKTNNSSADIALDVRTLPTWKITLVPVTTPNTAGATPATLTGAVDTGNMAGYVDMAKRIWPVPDAVDVSVRAAFASSLTAPLASDGSNWGTVLSETSALRTSDGSTRYYYGVVGTTYGGGVAGLGYVPGHAAIGWDKSGSRAGVLAHEVGHNFSRPHSPCGGVSGADASYPYAGGKIGVTGWDAFAGSSNLKAAATYTDVMGYCGTQWVSDYCYTKVITYRAGNATNLAPEAAEECLILWGRVENGRVILEPAFPAFTVPTLPQGGDLALEGLDVAGRSLLRLPFTPTEVADLPEGLSSAHFAFAVPRRLLGGEALQALRVLDQGVETARHTRLATGPGPEPALVPLRVGPETQVRWDAERHPLLVVRDAQGQVRAFLRGGQGTLPLGPGLEVLACDGVSSRVLPVSGDSL